MALQPRYRVQIWSDGNLFLDDLLLSWPSAFEGPGFCLWNQPSILEAWNNMEQYMTVWIVKMGRWICNKWTETHLLHLCFLPLNLASKAKVIHTPEKPKNGPTPTLPRRPTAKNGDALSLWLRKTRMDWSHWNRFLSFSRGWNLDTDLVLSLLPSNGTLI